MGKAPRLTNEKIDIALKVLDGWTGKLTWDRYLAILELDVGHKYTKAALLRHPKFKNSWDKKRWEYQEEDNEGTQYGNKILKTALKKIESLEKEIERLKNDNELLTEKYVVWITNAANKGMTLDELNRPLPINTDKKFR